MKNKLVKLSAITLAVFGFGAVMNLQTAPVYAADDTEVTGGAGKALETVSEIGGSEESGNTTDLMPFINTAINFILGILGLLCVFMIIFGGVTYSTSQGDPEKVKRASSTLLYGIVGLVVALLAFAITNFVINGLFGTAS